MKEKYIEIIYKINNQLNSDIIDKHRNYSLLSGKTGIALYFFYFSRYSKSQEFNDKAFKIMEEVINELNSQGSIFTFAGGIAGIGWTIEHLNREGFIECDTNEVLSEIDEILFKSMIYELKRGNYDYLHGALGIALYFVVRFKSNTKIKSYLEFIILEMELASKNNGNNTIWESTLSSENGLRGYNLSLSHGLSSIISILRKIYDLGIQMDKTEILIINSLNFLQKYFGTLGDKCYFPSWIVNNTPKGFKRLAWCYGDLGTNFTLFQIANKFKNMKLISQSLAILISLSKERNLIENSVNDAGFCHGSVGIAHIFKILYKQTNESCFHNAANYWFDKTVEFSHFTDGYAGYKQYRPFGYVPSIDLLEGIAGIGLALISAVSDIEPAWDECLLLS